MKIPTIIKEYLNFSRKQTIGIVVLVIIIAVLLLAPYKFGNKTQTTTVADSTWMKAAHNLLIKDSANEVYTHSSANGNNTFYDFDNTGKTAATFFNFDPNTLDAQGFQRLGLRDKTIQTLMNYRNKGGRFKKPDDLQKIYGLRPDEFAKLKPYIVIAEIDDSRLYHHYADDKTQTQRQRNIDINTADTTTWKLLYGIGSKLAARIVNFRTKLGGFYTIEQVGETYGVPDSTFQKIKPYLQLSNRNINKINLNTATYEELNAHPYISGKLAGLILKQRKQGHFTNIEQVKELVAQTNDVYDKLINYLKVE